MQIDLEPEGKVYVVIDLSGSSTEGKNITKQCFDRDTKAYRKMCWIKAQNFMYNFIFDQSIFFCAKFYKESYNDGYGYIM